MSHFTALVVGDVQRQLAPFDEGDRTRFTPSTAEELAELRAKFEERRERPESLSQCGSFEEFLTEWEGLTLRDGKWGSTYNPDSKWDWYSVGGRWSKMLITKAGARCDSAPVGELDFAAMRAARVAEAEKWWAESLPSERAWRYGIDAGATRERYVEDCAKFSTFAVVMDGKWFERGRMGWWGVVSQEKPEADWQSEFDKLLASLPADARVTVVDCHI